MKKDCIFCKIIKREEKAYIIFEDEDICCFLDHDPINQGHILLVPKSHMTKIQDFSQNMQFSLFSAMKTISDAITKVFVPDGISIMQNGGIFDEIGHYHMHVFPRYKDDGFGWKTGAIVDVTTELQEHRQQSLINAINLKK